MLLTLMMLAVFSQCDRADSYCTFTSDNKWNISCTMQRYIVEDFCDLYVLDYFETM